MVFIFKDNELNLIDRKVEIVKGKTRINLGSWIKM